MGRHALARLWSAALVATLVSACRDKPPQTPATGAPGEAAPTRAQPGAPATAGPGRAPGIWASWTLADTGLGPIIIGMTPEQANAAVGGALELPQGITPLGCDYAFPRAEADLGFMIEQGQIVRVDVRRPDIRTALGAGVGDTEARLEALYDGRLQVSPQQHARGHYLAVLPADTIAHPHRIIFETEQGMVTAIRAGRLPQVQYLEGCP